MEPVKPHSTATAYRRQRQIEDCLYENLLHTPYQSISVADLCRQVGISRKAFYNYYHDKEDCLNAIVDRILRDAILHVTTTLPDSATPLETTMVLLDFWKDQKSLYDILFRNNLLSILMERHILYILKEDRSVLDLLSTPDVKSDTDILSCYVACQITLVLQWYLRGYDTPTEEMAKKLLRMLHAPMIPYSSTP